MRLIVLDRDNSAVRPLSSTNALRAALAGCLLAGACGGSTGQSGPGTGGTTGGGSGGNVASTGGSGAGTGGTGISGTGGRSAGTGGTGTGGAVVSGTGGRAAGTGGAGTGGAVVTGSGGATGNCTTPPAASPLLGWASLSGNGVTTTTGGGTATPQTVTTLAALTAAARGTAAAVIYVSGVLPNGSVSVGSNKTIVGLCGAELHGHVDVSGSANVIIRNIKIVGYGVGDCALDPSYDPAVGCSSGNDAVTVQNNAHHVWFDHDDISDGTDGNLDITSGSDFVTVSWTKFHYTTRTDPVGNDSTGASGHRFSNLIGSADGVPGDAGHLNVTWHHDWWADNVNQRMPRTRAGKIHLFNNLFTSTGDSYCTNAGFQTNLLVESNVYVGVRNPLMPDANGDMKEQNNIFTNTTGTKTATGVGFVPTYVYTPDDAAGIQAAVQAGAGPQ